MTKLLVVVSGLQWPFFDLRAEREREGHDSRVSESDARYAGAGLGRESCQRQSWSNTCAKTA